MGRIKVVSEWVFEYEDGSIQGPFLNSFTSAGLAKIAERIQGLSSPYLVIGDDTAPGFVITEVFRKPVSMITRDENMVNSGHIITQKGMEIIKKLVFSLKHLMFRNRNNVICSATMV